MPDDRPAPITQLLQRWKDGDEAAGSALMPLIYDELRRIARAHLRGERAGHTWQPTELVHEAYARLVELELDWRDRVHFLSMASRQMRRVLVDHARTRNRAKRGGGAVPVSLSVADAESAGTTIDLLLLDLALERLTAEDPRAGRAIELFYFGGLQAREIAEAVGVSPSTVERDLRWGRSWLRREMARSDRGDTGQ